MSGVIVINEQIIEIKDGEKSKSEIFEMRKRNLISSAKILKDDIELFLKDVESNGYNESDHYCRMMINQLEDLVVE